MKIVYFLFLCLIGLSSTQNQAKYAEELISNLFTSYDKQLKPNEVIYVEFQLFLIQILNVFASDQTMLFNVWTHQTWIDSRLKWNPNEYGNLTYIKINSDRVWR
jgi:hypothetical protein